MTTMPVSAVQPAECTAADAALRAVLDCTSQAEEWDAPTRQGVLAWVARQRDVLAAVEGKVLTAEREAGTWALRGDRDLAGFVGRQTRTGRGAGLAAVAQAGTLAAMPAVADALVDGPVTATHVAAITRATSQCPALAAELATPSGQAEVVGLARRLDGADFGKALAQLSASLDPATRQRSHDEQRATRFLNLTHTPSGTLVKGRLDTVAGHELGKALHALSPRPAIDDDRSSDQRRADALTTMVRTVMSDKDTLPGSVAPVHALLTLTQETFAALRAIHQDRVPAGKRGDRSAATRRQRVPGAVDPRPSDGDAAGRLPAQTTTDADAVDEAAPAPGSALDLVGRLRGVGAVTDESGQAWPASEIARALCDCSLTRAVVGAKQADLNLGRSSRLFKRQHWLALYATGTTSCAVSGCGMPLAFTELHHIAWWNDHHGHTDQANCLPYCSFHHHDIHRNAIAVTRLPDGRIAHHHPDGRPYGGDRPPTTSPDHTSTESLVGARSDTPLEEPAGDLLELLSA